MSRKVNDLKAFFKKRLSSYTFRGSIAPCKGNSIGGSLKINKC